MVAFIVGGSFIALALNDLTWVTFAILAALDLLSRQMCAASGDTATCSRAAAPALASQPRAMPLANRL